MLSGFLREVAENCALLGYYTANSGHFLLTFRDNLSVPSSGSRFLTLRTGPETSVRNYHYSLRNNPEVRKTDELRKEKSDFEELFKISSLVSGYCGVNSAKPPAFGVGNVSQSRLSVGECT